MNTTTAQKLSAVNGIACTITPEQAMELIKNLSSYALDGKPFDLTIYTGSTSWDSETPVASIGFGGFYNTNAKLKWSYTGSHDNKVIHYDSTKELGA
jgi:hypothetical protein